MRNRTASYAEHWVPCARSLMAPKSEETQAMRDGTTVHRILEDWLRGGPPPEESTEDRKLVEKAQKIKANLLEQTGYRDSGSRYIEYRGWFGRHFPLLPVPERGQTCRPDLVARADLILFNRDNKTAEVIDFKSGWSEINAAYNYQLYLGWLIAAELPEFHTDLEPIFRIISPRGVASWRPTQEELDRMATEVTQGIINSEEPTLPAVPGVLQCKYCTLAPTCNAHLAWLGRELDADDQLEQASPEQPPFHRILDQLESLAGKDADELTPAEVARALLVEEMVTPLFKNLRETWTGKVQKNPRALPGFKLVGGRGSKAWVDSDTTTTKKKLQGFGAKASEVTVTALRSPAQVSTLLKPRLSERQWINFQKLIIRKPGKPILVPETDSRPSITPENLFQPTSLEELL